MSSSAPIETDTTSQNDEIAALSSIYGEDFLVVDEMARLFDIRIRHEANSWFSMTLQILFPQHYPSKIPPVFEVHGTWLADCDELEVRDKMYSLYRHDEIVVFQWVEAIREFMNEKALQYGGDTIAQIHEEDAAINLSELIPDENVQISTDGSSLAVALDGFTDIVTTGTDLPEILHGEPFTDRKSTFQAHLAKVSTEQQMEDVLQELKSNRKIANATHNIVAFRIKKKDSQVILQDYDEDGEHNAGSRLLHLLQILNIQNYVVMVSRWYGGILLGPDRFKYINNCARDLLKTAKAFPEKTTKNAQHSKENRNKRKMKK